jgi:hypothetical protein
MSVKNNEAWLKVHFYKLQMYLVLLPDGYYSSAKRIIKAIEGEKHRTELHANPISHGPSRSVIFGNFVV